MSQTIRNSRQLELFDQRQLALDLAPGAASAGRIRPSIALLQPSRALPQERHHGLAFRHRISGEFVSQIFEREFQSRRKLHRVGDGFRQVGEKLLHLLRRFQITLGVARQQTPGSFQRSMIANAVKTSAIRAPAAVA